MPSYGDEGKEGEGELAPELFSGNPQKRKRKEARCAFAMPTGGNNASHSCPLLQTPAVDPRQNYEKKGGESRSLYRPEGGGNPPYFSVEKRWVSERGREREKKKSPAGFRCDYRSPAIAGKKKERRGGGRVRVAACARFQGIAGKKERGGGPLVAIMGSNSDGQ